MFEGFRDGFLFLITIIFLYNESIDSQALKDTKPEASTFNQSAYSFCDDAFRQPGDNRSVDVRC